MLLKKNQNKKKTLVAYTFLHWSAAIITVITAVKMVAALHNEKRLVVSGYTA